MFFAEARERCCSSLRTGIRRLWRDWGLRRRRKPRGSLTHLVLFRCLLRLGHASLATFRTKPKIWRGLDPCPAAVERPLQAAAECRVSGTATLRCVCGPRLLDASRGGAVLARRHLEAATIASTSRLPITLFRWQRAVLVPGILSIQNAIEGGLHGFLELAVVDPQQKVAGDIFEREGAVLAAPDLAHHVGLTAPGG